MHGPRSSWRLGRRGWPQDTLRDATEQEVHKLKRENVELKQLLAELSLEGYRLKKNGYPDAPGQHRYHRMSALEKTAVLAGVASSGLPKRKALGKLGVPKSTCYRWLRRKDQQGLHGSPTT